MIHCPPPPPRKVHLHSKKMIFLNFLSPQNVGEKNYIRTNHWKRCLLRGRYCKDVRQSTYILWSESLQVFLTFHDGTKIPSCTSNVSTCCETFQCSWKKFKTSKMSFQWFNIWNSNDAKLNLKLLKYFCL